MRGARLRGLKRHVYRLEFITQLPEAGGKSEGMLAEGLTVARVKSSFPAWRESSLALAVRLDVTILGGFSK